MPAFDNSLARFGLLGGGKRDGGWDGGWDGAGRSKNHLAILPGPTHYTMFSDPAMAATAIAFLDEAAPKPAPWKKSPSGVDRSADRSSPG